MHNLLPCCTHFLGYFPSGENSEYLIKGKINENVNEAIRTVSSEELRLLIEKTGYKNVTDFSANTYYCVKVSDVQVLENKTKADFDSFLKLFDGNNVLSEFSPKVMDYDWK